MTDVQDKPIRPPLGDVYDSLTWHDEQAIEQAFSVNVHDLMQAYAEGEASVASMATLTRVFEYVTKCREGAKGSEALKAVRNLTMAQVTDLMTAYIDHEDEPIPEEPVTEAGKGDGLDG